MIRPCAISAQWIPSPPFSPGSDFDDRLWPRSVVSRVGQAPAVRAAVALHHLVGLVQAQRVLDRLHDGKQVLVEAEALQVAGREPGDALRILAGLVINQDLFS